MARVAVELGGGLDVLFGGARSLGTVALAEPTVRALVAALADDPRFDPSRADLFLAGCSADGSPLLRPGILVLVNDADWELTGGYATALDDGDVVVFISTLHGG